MRGCTRCSMLRRLSGALPSVKGACPQVALGTDRKAQDNALILEVHITGLDAGCVTDLGVRATGGARGWAVDGESATWDMRG